LGAIIIWWFVPVNFFIQISLIFISILIGTYSSQIYAYNLKKKDPSEIVIDEVSGMWISLFFIPKTPFLFILGFILFRFFDIKKPSIINKVQHYSGGIGIMADDILAGFFTCIILQLGIYLLI